MWPGRVINHGDQFLAAVAVAAGVVDEFVDASQKESSLWGSGDGDPSTAPEVEQAFVAEGSEGSQDGVGVDLEDGREVAGEGEAIAGAGFAVGDGSADLGRDLEVARGGV